MSQGMSLTSIVLTTPCRLHRAWGRMADRLQLAGLVVNGGQAAVVDAVAVDADPVRDLVELKVAAAISNPGY